MFYVVLFLLLIIGGFIGFYFLKKKVSNLSYQDEREVEIRKSILPTKKEKEEIDEENKGLSSSDKLNKFLSNNDKFTS